MTQQWGANTQAGSQPWPVQGCQSATYHSLHELATTGQPLAITAAAEEAVIELGITYAMREPAHQNVWLPAPLCCS